MCKWDKDSDKDAAGGDTTNQSLTVTVTFLKKTKNSSILVRFVFSYKK